jgi:hypothetical protein
MQESGKFGSGPIFGSQNNFERYRITDLVRSRAETLKQAKGDSPPRLILTGYGSFRAEHERIHELLESVDVPHVYRDGPQRKHDWHSGWVAEAVELLFARP